MNYIDSNVIVAFALENHEKHELATKILDKLEGDRYISGFTLLELTEAVRDIMNDVEIQMDVDGEIKILFLIEYMIRISNVKVINPKSKMKNFKLINTTISIYDITLDAGRIVIETGLDSIRALHLAFARKIRAKNFVTFDEKIIEIKDKIENLYGIKILHDIE